MKKSLIFITLLLLSFTLVSAVNDFAYNRLYDGTQPIDGFNYSINVNTSDNWDTNIGVLSGVNDSQFSNNGGLLTAVKSWWDGLYCQLTGCTMQGSIDMDGFDIDTVGHVQFDPAGDGCVDEFCMEVDADMGKLIYSLPGGNVVNSIGFEQYFGDGRVRNTEGSTIGNCKAVWFTDSTGQVPEVQLTGTNKGYRIAQAIVGITTEEILDNQLGYVTSYGIVRECDTSAFNDGDSLFLASDGNFTNIPPTGNGTIFVGTVNRAHATEGEVNVDLRIVYGIEDVLYSRNNAGGLNLTNLSHLETDFVCLNEECTHVITTGTPEFNSISSDAVVFQHTEPKPAGDVNFMFLQENKTQMFLQVGLNNSYSGLGNSFGLIPNTWGRDYFHNGSQVNMSQLSNYPVICETFGDNFFIDGDSCRFAADTSGRGMPLFFTGDLEVWRELVVHGGLFSIGDADFNLNGNNMDITNGSMWVRTERIEEVGFEIGDNVTTLNANFDDGLLSPFEQITDGGIVDWTVVESESCHMGQCARALGGSGSPLRVMEANFSSSDLNNLNLSFWITSVLDGLDELTIDVNNNVGSGDVEVYSTSTANDDVFVSTILPSSMNNQSTVTIIATLTANNINTDVAYLDEIMVVGTATASTIANVTRFDSEYLLGDGNYRMFWNGSTQTLELPGNVTLEDVTEISLNVTDNVTANNFIARENYYYEDGSKLNDTFFRVDGTSQMQGNTNIGGNNITNVDVLTVNVVNFLGGNITFNGTDNIWDFR